jgi:hypothetical protein
MDDGGRAYAEEGLDMLLTAAEVEELRSFLNSTGGPTLKADPIALPYKPFIYGPIDFGGSRDMIMLEWDAEDRNVPYTISIRIGGAFDFRFAQKGPWVEP